MNSYRTAVRERYAAVDTATVADVLDEIGLPHQGLRGFTSLSGSRLAGWAYTIHGHSEAAPPGGDPKKMDACGGIAGDEVAVWSGEGDGIAYFGELIARGMAERGCVGALVQGAARDLRWLAEMGFPVFGTFRTPVQSIGRWLVDAWQQPVELPGATLPMVTINPGDFVLADEDGALVVPAERVLAVLQRAEELIDTEAKVRADLLAGSTLSEVLERYGHV